MSGTVEGGVEASKKNKQRHGEDFYARIGKKGGSAKVPKGFALNRELARTAGALGGRKGKRGKAVSKSV